MPTEPTVTARTPSRLPRDFFLLAAAASASTFGLMTFGVISFHLVDAGVKALVADLVPRQRLATAYGVFAACQGVAALAGGTVAGLTYASHLPLLTGLVAALQVGALALLAVVLRRQARERRVSRP